MALSYPHHYDPHEYNLFPYKCVHNPQYNPIFGVWWGVYFGGVSTTNKVTDSGHINVPLSDEVKKPEIQNANHYPDSDFPIQVLFTSSYSSACSCDSAMCHALEVLHYLIETMPIALTGPKNNYVTHALDSDLE